MAHELGHYVLGHPNYDDAHQRERDANAKGVEIMVRLGTGGDEALRRMHAVLVGTYRFQARTGKWPSLGHNPCAEIRRRIRAAASAAHRAASPATDSLKSGKVSDLTTCLRFITPAMNCSLVSTLPSEWP